MLKFVAITLLIGVVAAAPSGLYAPLALTAPAPLAYSSTYAQPTTLTRYESISSPLTYTASHQPALALTNVAQVPLTYSNYAAYPLGYNGIQLAY